MWLKVVIGIALFVVLWKVIPLIWGVIKLVIFAAFILAIIYGFFKYLDAKKASNSATGGGDSSQPPSPPSPPAS
ncbi:MAG: hypothetical protein HYW78_01275 [Parcubacteria group bacterium]|nr:hypothetical protein [Parcubacteria group bacterium]